MAHLRTWCSVSWHPPLSCLAKSRDDISGQNIGPLLDPHWDRIGAPPSGSGYVACVSSRCTETRRIRQRAASRKAGKERERLIDVVGPGTSLRWGREPHLRWINPSNRP